MFRAALLLAFALALEPSADAAPLPGRKPHNATAGMANTQEAIRRYRRNERVRMLHGSGLIPEVTMEFWKEVTTGPDKGPTLIIAAAAGEGAPGSAASYISNFARFGIEMVSHRIPPSRTRALRESLTTVACARWADIFAHLWRQLPRLGRRPRDSRAG